MIEKYLEVSVKEIAEILVSVSRRLDQDLSMRAGLIGKYAAGVRAERIYFFLLKGCLPA